MCIERTSHPSYFLDLFVGRPSGSSPSQPEIRFKLAPTFGGGLSPSGSISWADGAGVSFRFRVDRALPPALDAEGPASVVVVVVVAVWVFAAGFFDRFGLVAAAVSPSS